MNIIYVCLSVIALSFLSVYSITPYIIKLANKINFLDNPNARKVHKKATPLLGGLAVFIGFFILTVYIVIMNLHSFNYPIIGYLLGAFIIILVGIIDDKFGMKPIIKLMGQILSCFIFYTLIIF